MPSASDVSDVSEWPPVRRGPLVVGGGVLLAILLASLANALIAVLAHALGASEDFHPLEPSAYPGITALGVQAGAIGWAAVRRFAKDPERLLRWLVPTVVAVSFVPDFFLFEEGGVLGVAALLAMHVAVAVISVKAYRTVMPLGPVR